MSVAFEGDVAAEGAGAGDDQDGGWGFIVDSPFGVVVSGFPRIEGSAVEEGGGAGGCGDGFAVVFGLHDGRAGALHAVARPGFRVSGRLGGEGEGAGKEEQGDDGFSGHLI